MTTYLSEPDALIKFGFPRLNQKGLSVISPFGLLRVMRPLFRGSEMES